MTLRDSARQAVAKWRAKSEASSDASYSGYPEQVAARMAEAIAYDTCADELEALVRALPGPGSAVAWQFRTRWRTSAGAEWSHWSDWNDVRDEAHLALIRHYTEEAPECNELRPLFAAPPPAAADALVSKLIAGATKFAQQYQDEVNNTEGEWNLADSGCYECTEGTVPWDRDTGLCGYHATVGALAALTLVAQRDAATQHPASVVGNGETK